MGLFRKRHDPISDRERALNEEIAQLESQIKKIDSRLQRDESQPRLRSTTLPYGTTLNHDPVPTAPPPPTPAPPEEPVFEDVDLDLLKEKSEVGDPSEQYNELGVRKYNLPALLSRLKSQFRGPTTTNPKLVSYLAAGGIQGLRPMRYERRVARNRFIALVIILFFTLLGIIAVFVQHR